ncbi:MAG: alpha/beta fold hydrolase, partial [Pseudomonadales bacterium]|nr:alpha/beta fold hydrolase [Pseudomonadales bacterium]
RGHGETGWAAPEDYGTSHMVADLRAFVTALGLDGFNLLGLSMGGNVAIHYAGAAPAELKRLVIVDIGPELSSRGVSRIQTSVAESDVFDTEEEAFQRARAGNERAPDDHLRHRVINNLMKLQDGRWTFRYDRALRDASIQRPRPSVEEAWQAVANIAGPTLLIRGEESDSRSEETANRMVDEIGECSLVTVTDSGHSVPLDKPEGFLDAVRGFLSGVGPEIAVYLEPWQAVYIEIPKVACTSIKVALADLLDIELEGGNPHQTAFPSVDYEQSDHGPLYPGLFSFAFVRNPWDRLVSCYRDKILLEVDGFTDATIRPGIANCFARFDEFRPGMSFDEFVDAVVSIPDEDADVHFRSQYTFVTNRSMEVAVDYLGRYETLTEGVAHIGQRLGLPSVELPRLQAVLSLVPYRGFYSRGTRDLVAERFKTDIALFRYDF